MTDDHRLSATAIAAAFAAGGTVSSIARSTGVDRRTVRRRLQRHGIVNPLAHRGTRPGSLDDVAWLRSQYVDAARPIQSIADELGCISRTVRAALVRYGIEVDSNRQGRRGGRAPMDDDWLRRRIDVDGASVAEVVVESGYSSATVYRHIAALGLTVKPWRLVRRPPIAWPHGKQYDEAWLQRRYVDERVTMAAIGKEAGVATSTVHHAVTRYGLTGGRRL